MVLKDNDYPFRRTLKKGKAMRVVHSAAAFARDASLPGTAVIRSGFKSNYAERTEPAVLPFPRPPQCAKDGRSYTINQKTLLLTPRRSAARNP